MCLPTTKKRNKAKQPYLWTSNHGPQYVKELFAHIGMFANALRLEAIIDEWHDLGMQGRDFVAQFGIVGHIPPKEVPPG